MLQQDIAIAKPKRHTRDEMNLAEFPLTLLSTRSDPKIKTLEFRDHIRGKNGDLINREWIITGADKFGLPTASDDEVLIGLLKLSVDQGFEERKVYFTRYELLKALHWTTEGRSYHRLMKALDRLSGVRIKATNAFFDNSSKTHSTVNFGIIDAYEINDGRDISGRESGSSFFIWSEVLFKSFQVGYIKKLDLTFYLALQSAVSKRMFRYLDKHFWYRSRLVINVFTLAHEKLGISRNYKYLSSIRQQIDPALDELVKQGFLAGYEYQGRGEGAEIIITSQSGVPRVNDVKGTIKESLRDNYQDGENTSENLHKTDKTPRMSTPQNPNRSTNQTNFEQSNANRTVSTEDINDKLLRLTSALAHRGLKPKQAEGLLSGLTESQLDKVARIIEHFDSLVYSGSKFVSKSPVGFLYRAVENPENFNLPGDGSSSRQGSLDLKSGFKKGSYNRDQRDSRNTLKAESTTISSGQNQSGQHPSGQHDLTEIKARYLLQRKRESKRLRQEVEAGMLKKIRAEVEVALSKFKANISAKNFDEAVEHGIEERLLTLFAFPDFEEWVRTQQK